MTNNQHVIPVEGELVVERIFNAPRERVWRAWTQADKLAQWWGPKGFEMGVTSLDLRPGGLFRYSMRAPNGAQMWGRFLYQEVSPIERLVFTSAFADQEGNAQHNPMAPTFPLEIQNTLTLIDQGKQTKLVLRGIPYNATDEERQTFSAMSPNVQIGMKGTLDQLDAFLGQGE